MSFPLVLLKNVSKQFLLPQGQNVTILKDISLTVAANQTLSISGISGSGKSTLLNLIAGLDYPSSGSIFWKEKCISELSADQRASLRQGFIGFIFQGSNLIPELTVSANILLSARIAKKDPSVYEERAKMLLQRLGISELAHRMPNLLSGGERQRVAIARALILSPELIIADEPTGNLDEENAHGVIELLLELCKIYTTSLVLVTHNPYLADQTQHAYKITAHRLEQWR
ncbi:MAG: ABC transporter ATP-binding protein [Puniceicoccales bacterium]|jgi:ABC-type lipoprotein export system ATPase subunit|nr:ABC transporter ATP-binding protein [Puniceicoccales bacterium]